MECNKPEFQKLKQEKDPSYQHFSFFLKGMKTTEIKWENHEVHFKMYSKMFASLCNTIILKYISTFLADCPGLNNHMKLHKWRFMCIMVYDAKKKY